MDDLWSDYAHFRSKKYTSLSLELLRKRFQSSHLLLTHSATGALEMIAKAIQIQPGDEVIMPSFTFVSTANAFVSHGATPVFVDISLEDFNIDFYQIEQKITKNTKAIVVTHYGGHATDLTRIQSICQQHGIFLIEDAAMSYGNFYEGKPLGTIGDFGVISFDITKQISAVQGGLLLVNLTDFTEKMDTIYHIGTNRTHFENQATPYYEWVDVGSKYQMNEQNAVVLYDHLLHEDQLLGKRKEISNWYFEKLHSFVDSILPVETVKENIHLFYWLSKSAKEREDLRFFLLENHVEAMFHYIPLHSSKMGKRFGEYQLPNTDRISSRLLRLPLHVHLDKKQVGQVCDLIFSYQERHGRKR